VLHKEEAPDATSEKDQTKKSLLEVLKSDDKLRNELFGHINNVSIAQTKELSQEDKQSLAKLGLMNIKHSQHDNSKSSVNIDLEMNDSLPRSNIGLKFVAFKTPSTSAVSFPKSLFFTFKFFTFTTVQTDPVNLHFENEINPANQYYLVLPDQLKMR